MALLNASIAAEDGAHFGAYASRPVRPNGHAIILLQEIFGVTATIRRVADAYAQDGYLVYAPDLFWRMEPELQLSHSKADIERALGLLARYRDEDGLADIARTAAHIRALPGFAGGIAVVGLCLGGKLAYRAAAHAPVDAAVGYYGVGIEQHLDEAARLRCPLMLHFGTADDYVPPAALDAIEAALSGQQRAQVHRYEGEGHGFYTRGSAEAIGIAHARTQAFLQTALDRHA